jgi:hypothetical protein
MPFSIFDPHLPESDARQLCMHVTEALRSLGTLPTSIGVHLERDGFYFTAMLKGKTVTARTGKQTVTYDAIAKELLLLANEPFDRGAEIDTITLPNGVQV